MVRRRVLTLLVTALGPIPLATMGSSEWRSTGQNYLKSLLALGFQAFLIMIVVGIYAVLIRNISGAADIAGAIWAHLLRLFCPAEYLHVVAFITSKGTMDKASPESATGSTRTMPTTACLLYTSPSPRD